MSDLYLRLVFRGDSLKCSDWDWSPDAHTLEDVFLGERRPRKMRRFGFVGAVVCVWREYVDHRNKRDGGIN